MSNQTTLNINSTLLKGDIVSVLPGGSGSTVIPTLYSGTTTFDSSTGYFPLLQSNGNQLVLPSGFPTHIAVQSNLLGVGATPGPGVVPDVALYAATNMSTTKVSFSTGVVGPVGSTIGSTPHPGVSYLSGIATGTFSSQLPVQANIPVGPSYYAYVYAATTGSTGPVSVTVRMV